MHLTSDHTLKVTLAHPTHPPIPTGSPSSPLPAPQNRQLVHSDQPPQQENSSTHLLYSCFRNLACVGQVGSAIIAMVFAIELASSLTLAMIILGIFWIGCEHFGSDEEGNRV